MAMEFPESDKTDAQDPGEDADPVNADPGHVPLLPPGEVHPLPGQLETAPDGSIRPAGPQEDMPDPSLAPPPGPEAAPPPPGLAPPLAEEPEPTPIDAPPSEGVGAPSWAVTEPPSGGIAESAIDGANAVERAAWPTVEPLDAVKRAPAPPIEEATRPEPAAEPPTPPEPPPVPEFADSAGDAPDIPEPTEPAEAPAEPVLTPVDPPQEHAAEPEQTTVRAPEEAVTGDDMYDIPLGTLVYRSGLLSAHQIESALAESERLGKRLGEVLIDSEMLDERDLGRLLAGQKGLPFLDLGQMEIERQATELLPAASARIYCALPIAVDQSAPIVAVSDPTNGLVVEGVRRAIGGELSFAVATRSDLQRAIASSYGETADDDGGDAPLPGSEAPGIDRGETPDGLAPDPTPEEPMTSSQPDLTPQMADASTENPFAPPTCPAEPGSGAAQVAATVRVMIRLSDGDKVDAGNYTDEAAAIERARSLISALEAQGGMEWLFLNGRFLRPETIVSIDLVEERQRY